MRAASFCVLGMVLLISSAARADHVQADLLSDVRSIQPGHPFWLGVRLNVDPGWHIYWKNPGDSGLPTRVKFNLPGGFTAGELQYPVPHRFVLPGNIVCFGYENTVMLLAKITPPDDLPANFQGQFDAQISWLVCSEVCIPGKTTASLTLGSGAAGDSSNRELFDDWIGQLPVKAGRDDLKSLAIRVRNVAGSASRNCTIELRWSRPAPDSADFFPQALDDYNLVNTQVKSSEDTTVIGFMLQPLAGKTPAAITLDGTVGYDQQGKRRGIDISVALPAVGGNNH
jgi:DsbC/DsbD-like thiol-disulfide interchange protein